MATNTNAMIASNTHFPMAPCRWVELSLGCNASQLGYFPKLVVTWVPGTDPISMDSSRNEVLIVSPEIWDSSMSAVLEAEGPGWATVSATVMADPHKSSPIVINHETSVHRYLFLEYSQLNY